MNDRGGARRRQRFGVFGPGEGSLGRARGVLGAIALIAALLAPSLLGAGRADAAPLNWEPPRTVYIAETGQTIDGVFLDFWRGNSGLSLFGNPITPELQERGRVVQYYQYARFEYVPEDPNGAVVQLGSIGQELRPQVLFRSTPIVDRSRSGSDAANELALVARAWLPLDAKSAAQPISANWRYVPETKHSVQHGFKALWEATGEAAYLGNPLTEEYVLRGVTYQVFERGQLAWQNGIDPWLVPLGEMLAKRFKLDMEPRPQGDIPIYDEALFIPPKPVRSSGGERWIEINLSSQYLIAWEGNTSVGETYVSTGRAGFDTPAGTFFINVKVESEDMAGVLGGEEYNVPDVPWTMYFTDVGHAIHGAYWHSNFGYVMSHGCVNLPLDFAAWLYGWAPSGTRVEIHY